jgi:CheY-like chemotaxis protein
LAKVLVVDDDTDNCELLVRFLHQSGHAGHGVYDGPSAFDAVARLRPDLVFLDVHMPGISGLDVLRKLRADERYRSIPVIMLSGDGDPSCRRAAIEGGAQEFLLKGRIDLAELEDAVSRGVHGGHVIARRR